ncbi:60 kDa lysophospholipase isoform X2 [Prionailurus viverrinus]|nr:60 kDa lysophospholipase isoform X2 [Prionailurus viverrinus]XP_047719993.1 60 kDa lysophospholipase isoform X2 [Prionailurus viverrinus]XP_047719995.1 60 kDa lysophospholipase isoform X2 [Prionailurus viverrinus]
MFHDEDHARALGLPEDTLVLPPASPDQRVIYTVLECQPLFDSSDMTITEWVQIAQTIERHYGQYHGFVVIHGTDTMAFAASVLSFVLENLQKTVILTGAQVPIHALWNDGRENLLGALLMAGQYVIPEVCLFFQNQLFRGNRVTKVDSRRFAAFCSPNLPPLAVVGADVILNRELVRKVRGKERLVVHSSVERDVGLLRLYPGIPAALVRAFLQPPLRGVVMETFGCGNGPTKPDLLREFRAATERGLLIVNCTHCLQGTVTSGYAAGMAVAGAGIVSGFDMTSEAAMAKLSYVLGQPGLSLDSRKQLLARDLRGEVTLPAGDEHQPSLTCSTLGRGVAQLLSLSQEADAVREALTPGLACAAAHAGDLDVLQALVELGSDLSQENFNGQTPLHAAARGGHPEVVTMLLQRGVGVSARDEDGLSPLLLAVKGRHQGIIGLLRAAGACLSPQELEDAGTELCRLASRADLEGLQSWWRAGADLACPGYDGRSALLVDRRLPAGLWPPVSEGQSWGPSQRKLRPLCDAPYQSTGGPRPWPRGSWSLEGTSDPSTACPAHPAPPHWAGGSHLPPTSHPIPPLRHLALQKTLKSGWVCSGPWVPPWERTCLSVPPPHTACAQGRDLKRPPVFRQCCLVSNLKLPCCGTSHSFLLWPAGGMPPHDSVTYPHCWDSPHSVLHTT